MRRRIAMNQLPRHVKDTFYCEECDRVYPIRYMDRHQRTYKHQRNLLMLENVPRIHPSEVDDILKESTVTVRPIPLESFELKEVRSKGFKEISIYIVYGYGEGRPQETL